jgi:hypothetical protein
MQQYYDSLQLEKHQNIFSSIVFKAPLPYTDVLHTKKIVRYT